jgi:ribosome biogenesis GTPase A
MSIQWFPGHMHLTRKAITERVKEIDVVIEMLDARLPGSSANPLLAELTAGRPTLKVVNKQDMADPARTALWLDHYNAQPNTRAISLDASETSPARAIIAACHELAPLRGGMVKPMRVLICGIPNVGKSTLINTLKGKRAAKTGDEAGVTRTESRIALADDFYLYDTPGMLWPRIVVPESGYNLAASGAVGKNAYDEQEVAFELMDKLKRVYGAELDARYKLGMTPEAIAEAKDEDLLEAVGRKRSALTSGGRVDPQKCAEI